MKMTLTEAWQAPDTSGLDPRHRLVQARFDLLIVAVLLFTGWSGEWTWGRQEGAAALLLLYARLALYPLFFFYYFQNRRQLCSPFTADVSRGLYPLLLAVFVCVCLVERSTNEFADIRGVWKDYYYLALLPFWGLLGFDLGGDLRRVQLLVFRLAVAGALLAYVSFAMQSLGFSAESLVGPMSWPYRFIVIFSFFYFLSAVTTGVDRTWWAWVWLLGSSFAVCWGFYKYTMVSTVLGTVAWVLFMMAKGRAMGRKGVLVFLALVMLSLIGVVAANQLCGGSLFSAVGEIFADRWTHNVDQFNGTDQEDRFNEISAGRYRMWAEVLNRVDERPLLGAGLGQRYEGDIVTHNGFLDLLLSFGMVGAGLFLAALAVWLKGLWRSSPDGSVLLIQSVCIGYVFTILSANLFGSVWIQFFTISFYTMLLGGISCRLCAKRKAVR